MEWVGVAFSKYSMLVLLAVALIAFFWRFGRTVFAGVTKWILWALAMLCACAGLLAVLSSEGQSLPILGGIILCAFAAYTIKVAGAGRTGARIGPFLGATFMLFGVFNRTVYGDVRLVLL